MMRVKIRNQIRLKNPLKGLSHECKCKELLKIIVPNHKRVYGDFDKYFEDLHFIDEFDDKQIKIPMGMGGNLYKIKEIVPGLWMTRSDNGVCYIKEHWFIDNMESFHVE